MLPLYQVSETEREDLEESEKVQHWVERLCQTRLEQISCVENESPEVQSEKASVKTLLSFCRSLYDRGHVIYIEVNNSFLFLVICPCNSFRIYA